MNKNKIANFFLNFPLLGDLYWFRSVPQSSNSPWIHSGNRLPFLCIEKSQGYPCLHNKMMFQQKVMERVHYEIEN